MSDKQQKKGKPKEKGNGFGSVYPVGKKWRWQVTLGRDENGEPIRRSGTTKTKTEAEQIKNEMLAALKRGELKVGGEVTLAEFLPKWLDEKKRTCKRKTVYNYESLSRQFIVPELGGKTLRELSTEPAIILDFYAKLGNEKNPDGTPKYSDETIRTVHCALSSALGYAYKRGHISHPPKVAPSPRRNVEKELARAKKGLQHTPGRWDVFDPSRAWTPEEVRLFASVAQDDRWGIMLLFILATGLRRGEACGLTWDDVDLASGTIIVTQHRVVIGGAPVIDTPKTELSRRELPLSGEALQYLRARQDQQSLDRAQHGARWADTDHVFTYAVGTPIHPDNLKREMTRLCEATGVRRIRIHELRDTFVTLLARQRVPIEVISRYLGHSDPTFTLTRYRQVLKDELRQCSVDLLRACTAGFSQESDATPGEARLQDAAD